MYGPIVTAPHFAFIYSFPCSLPPFVHISSTLLDICPNDLFPSQSMFCFQKKAMGIAETL